ncbi:MAG: pyridoxamine 5'-phosphate oxidase family protein [Acidimicrobiales bacterium]
MSDTETRRLHGLRLLVRSLRTGELTAAEQLRPHLAPGVTVTARNGYAAGVDGALRLLSGQHALTPTLRRAHWSLPRLDGDAGLVEAVCPDLGAAPSRVTLRVAFDGDHRMASVAYEMELWEPPVSTAAMPDHVRAAIDDALANGTPLVLAYTGADGTPHLSLRGSIQTAGPLLLTLWARKPEGFVEAVAADPRVTLLYRNSPTRTTLTIIGRARVVADEAERQRIYELSPEVEQLHDPGRTGVAVAIDVERVQGTSPHGMVLVER